MPLEYAFQKGRQGRTVSRAYELPQAPFHQARTFNPEHFCGSEVDLPDSSIGSQGEVAYRRKVVEVGVTLQGSLELGLGFEEAFVLQFHLDLVYFQLLLEAPRVGSGPGQGRGAALLQARLRGPTQTGGIRGGARYHISCMC